MSGETIRLSGDAFIVGALRALAELPETLPDHAMIGGLAVMIRLQQTHRVTGDVDLVSVEESRAIELLVGAHATRTRNGVRLASGVDVDLIDATAPGVAVDAATDNLERAAIERQFAFAHALESATRVNITASAAELGLASASVRVATAADLVVLKLHSTLDPRREANKRGTDMYDLVRLLLRHGTASVATALARAPAALHASTVRFARQLLVDEADRSAAMLRRSSVRGVEAVPVEQLEALGRALVAAINDAADD